MKGDTRGFGKIHYIAEHRQLHLVNYSRNALKYYREDINLHSDLEASNAIGLRGPLYTIKTALHTCSAGPHFRLISIQMFAVEGDNPENQGRKG